MSASLLVAREFLERALSLARSRADERLIGERLCAIAELQELEECRVLAEVKVMSAEQLDVLAPTWRHFTFGEIHEALAWAKAGNVAVHHTGFPFRQWKYTCHLFARDEQALRAAARSIGVQLKWIQHAGTNRVHYDIFGAPLDRAFKLCGVSVPPSEDDE